MNVKEVIDELDAEREKIWLTCPDEVKDIGQGIVPRGTGSRGQYFSTLVFAEGEARTLADEMLWGIIQVCEKPDADLGTLKHVISEIIGYKADFFDFVGLPHAAAMIHKYVAAAQECGTLDELKALSSACLTYANRVHMWVDAVFPWGLGNAFKRVDRRYP
ncbi:hypothetical protein [Methylobrevis pamukkalensis]|uniref:Cucumopine synthase C-terminal helical bundle domain-containing protein n=1 Tax=Methylobrevis pamukkalensis TaxID=1439726 RepID=A0A1E3H425_9HYPH|nr:hypothetical protein [Methylobrevis pamukkalensis]ODN71060.1 hypothetical protein A6302_01621 [Methylobrevis pamukkalensis]